MSAPKLCKDCKHYVGSPKAEYDRCKKSNMFDADTSLVRGEGANVAVPSFCDIQRKWNWIDARLLGKCGREGRWWEAK